MSNSCVLVNGVIYYVTNVTDKEGQYSVQTIVCVAPVLHSYIVRTSIVTNIDRQTDTHTCYSIYFNIMACGTPLQTCINVIILDHTQYVDYDGVASANTFIETGVIQDSTLGPVLFAIYITIYKQLFFMLAIRHKQARYVRLHRR